MFKNLKSSIHFKTLILLKFKL